MSSCTIAQCRRPLRAHEHRRGVCDRCARRMSGWLHELDLQRILLQSMLVPGSNGPAQGSVHGGRAHSPLPARGDVLTLLGPGASSTLADPYGDARGDQDAGMPLDAVLRGWAEATAEHIRLRADRPEPGSSAATGPRATPWLRPGSTWSTWLVAYLPWALTAPWAGDLHTELDDLVQHARRITHTEPRRRPKSAPCPACGAFALVEEDWQTYIECTLCEALLTPHEYELHAQSVMPTLYRTALLIAAHNEEKRREEQTQDTEQPTITAPRDTV